MSSAAAPVTGLTRMGRRIDKAKIHNLDAWPLEPRRDARHIALEGAHSRPANWFQ